MLFLFLLFCYLPRGTNAIVRFSETPSLVWSVPDYFSNYLPPVAAGDLDGDGDVDIVAARGYGGSIHANLTWFENSYNKTTSSISWVEHVISATAYPVLQVYAVDVDNDNDLDIVAVQERVRLYRNSGFNGGFANYIYLASPLTESEDATIYPADFNNDGKLDFLFGETPTGGNPNVRWMQQGGPSENLAINRSEGFFAVFAGDIDKDGLQDAVSLSRDGRLSWFKNQNQGFAGSPEQIISNNTQLGIVNTNTPLKNAKPYAPQSLFLADMDGDGDLDLLTVNATGPLLWKNQGSSPNFGPPQLLATVNAVSAVFASDFDGDGDLDIAWISKTDLTLGVMENQKLNGGFTTATLYPTISLDFPGAIIPADVDGDGDLDIVCSNYLRVIYYENTSPLLSWGTTNVYTAQGSCVGAVGTADWSRDGLVDLLYQTSYSILYSPARGFGTYSLATNVASMSFPVKTAPAFAVGDFDGDGMIDAVVNVPSQLIFFRNNGIGFSSTTLSTTTTAGTPIAADFNQNRYADFTLTTNEKTSVWESRGTSWVEHVILNHSGSYGYSAVLDFDGDDLPDIAVFNGVSNLTVLRNSGNFAFKSVSEFVTNDVRTMDSGDLDGDGDIDLVLGGGGVFVCWNSGPPEYFSSPCVQLLDASVADVRLFDYDSDNDIDIAVAVVQGILGLLENVNLNEGFSSPMMTIGALHLSGTFSNIASISVNDLDNDGDLDLFVGSCFGADTFGQAVSSVDIFWNQNFVVKRVDPSGSDLLCAVPTVFAVSSSCQTLPGLLRYFLPQVSFYAPTSSFSLYGSQSPLVIQLKSGVHGWNSTVVSGVRSIHLMGAAGRKPGGTVVSCSTAAWKNYACLHFSRIGNLNISNLMVQDASKGAVIIQEGKLFAYRSSFQSNRGIDGAGLSAISSTLVLNTVVFDQNIATARGGGLFTSNSILTLKNSRFSGNKAVNGGGFYVDNQFTYTNVIMDSWITDNEAQEGGGFYAVVAKLEFIRSDITSNKATLGRGGGGSLFRFCDLQFTDSFVTRNAAMTQGGGLFIGPLGTATITNITFYSNFAGSPSATYTSSPATYGSGGALYADLGTTTTWVNATVMENRATGWGGGACAYMFDMWNVSGATAFLDNEAMFRDGGALYMTATGTPKSAWSTTAVFEGNLATNGGGGLVFFASLSMSTSPVTLSLPLTYPANSNRALYGDLAATQGTRLLLLSPDLASVPQTSGADFSTVIEAYVQDYYNQTVLARHQPSSEIRLVIDPQPGQLYLARLDGQTAALSEAGNFNFTDTVVWGYPEQVYMLKATNSIFPPSNSLAFTIADCLEGSGIEQWPSPRCTVCPWGKVSNIRNANSTSCTPCPGGTFQSAPNTQTCVNCGSGNWSQPGATTCYACNPGEYTVLQTSCIPCQAGQYQSNFSSTTCVECPTGKYSALNHSAKCDDVPAGFYQNETGQTHYIPCPAGSYNPSLGSSRCTECEAGKYQPLTSKSECLVVSKGFYVNQTGATSQTPCPQGYYANVDGMSECLACPPGTYPNLASAATLCNPCPLGTASNLTGAAICPNCTAGFSGPVVGLTSCVECVAGSFAAGSKLYGCWLAPKGNYVNTSGATSFLPCPSGYFSNFDGATSCTPCSLGSIAAQPGAITCTPCPKGKFSETNASDTCMDCPAGSSQPQVGGSFCLGCEVGRYAPKNGSEECQYAPLGHFVNGTNAIDSFPCLPGTFSALVGAQQCQPCPNGTSSNAIAALTCSDCPPGFYAPDVGFSHCLECVAGFSGPRQGLTMCQECVAGFFSSKNQSVVCTAADKGAFVDAARATSATSCDDGFYTSRSGMSRCEACEIGRYGSNGSCIPASKGSFVELEGATSEEPCPPGHYSNSQGRSNCTACDKGYYAPNNGTAECFPCPTGAYANVTAATHCYLCAPGRYAGQVASWNCTECELGKWRNDGQAAVCNLAEKGSLVNTTGATAATPCPAGYFSDSPGATRCDMCPPGRYNNNTNSATCLEAPRGTVATRSASLLAQACPPGTYSKNASEPCKECVKPLYSSSYGASECSWCPGRSYPMFASDGTLSECVKCSVGMNCDDYTHWPTSTTGYYVAEMGQSGVFTAIKCNSCENNTCINGRENPPETNPLCGRCSEGLYEWGGACVECKDSYKGVIFLLVIASWVYVVIIHILAQSPDDATVKVLLYFVATVRFMLRDELQWFSWLKFFDFNPDATASHGLCIAPLEPIPKLVFSVLFPLVIIAQLFFTGLFHFALSKYRGDTATTSAVETTGPNSNQNIFARKFSIDQYYRTLLVFGILSYTTITDVVLSYMHCVKVGHYSVVFTSPGIDCDSAQYKNWLGFFVTLLIFPVIGFPLFILGMLVWYRKELFLPIGDLAPLASKIGTVYENYQPKRYWWEFIAIVRRTVLVTLGSSITNPTYLAQAYVGLAFGLCVLHLVLHPYRNKADNHNETVALVGITSVALLQAGVLDSPDVAVHLKVLISLFIFGPIIYLVAKLVHYKTQEVRTQFKRRLTAGKVPAGTGTGAGTGAGAGAGGGEGGGEETLPDGIPALDPTLSVEEDAGEEVEMRNLNGLDEHREKKTETTA